MAEPRQLTEARQRVLNLRNTNKEGLAKACEAYRQARGIKRAESDEKTIMRCLQESANVGGRAREGRDRDSDRSDRPRRRDRKR